MVPMYLVCNISKHASDIEILSTAIFILILNTYYYNVIILYFNVRYI